ncbi:hypothetical protein FGO68_gene9625 [Halteria grandinella]|uniref:Uncharacterized protein n=1 Tax=Halteria grandinella TaxID=5974 RepID=A0A8J8T9M4_HALGN|nr:hypothetical protein FGO68_gene9625 [Halteria grandinella]
MFRMQKGLSPGVETTIQGHPWYKWIDSGLQPTDIQDIINRMRILYSQPSAPQVSSGGANPVGAGATQAPSHVARGGQTVAAANGVEQQNGVASLRTELIQGQSNQSQMDSTPTINGTFGEKTFKGQSVTQSKEMSAESTVL